jgi:hypothetical protein
LAGTNTFLVKVTFLPVGEGRTSGRLLFWNRTDLTLTISKIIINKKFQFVKKKKND